MGRITLPLKMRFERELEYLGGLRDALNSLEKQNAYDEVIRSCTTEQATLANANAPAVLRFSSVHWRMIAGS